ncbi:MAG: PEFG-CTERM sorting domain-containing protein [Nitrosopumilus sp.]|nr:PEFG-CTERM sorting domain-containing protein [Nitrosopumilus sp.]NRA05166.1 PEFG-CTERM sorting domain-containing protein [Nitrosopumilus sp.]
MKAHLTVFALSAILIASIGLAPAFGQSSVVVATDKASYSEGDTILVTGEVSQLLGGYALSLTVVAPNGNIVVIDQLTVGSDKKISTSFAAGGSLMKVEGTYTITVQYGDNKNNSGTTSFEFGGVTEEPVDQITSTVTDTTVSVGEGNDLIGYEITGGKLLSIIPDVDSNSLIISIDATDDGSLTLTIPRSVMDATINGGDDDFFVLIDGEEVDFDEITTSTDRTLTIAFPAGAEEIEIIGTFVVPEFGTIAAMILAVAIISIIAISAKSRLSIMPRY